MAGFVAIGILLIAGIVLMLQGDGGSVAGFNADNFGFLALWLALLVFLGSGLFAGYRGRASSALKDALSWVAVALILIVGYTYREELARVGQRVVSELVPSMSVEMETTGPAEVRIRRHLGGHFIVEAKVNGTETRMIVDTGASTVVLTPEDAEAAGINLRELHYIVPVQTANGTALAARARLDSIAVGPLRLRNITALVARESALGQSLLGMSFLSRLRSYEFAGDYLTLRG